MRLICVTGMHRSGTSLAARILNLLGVDLGPEDALMDATDANPRGYWEAEAISDLNDEMLRHLDGWWRDVPPMPPGWENDPELAPFRARAQEIVDGLFEDVDEDGVAGFKDPRTSLTLAFWRQVIDIDATLLVLRDPAEVAGSLHRRDELDPELSASLWTDHVLSAWVNDPHRHVVTYDELLADPVAAAVAIAGALGLPEPDEETSAAIEEFRDTSLQRSAGFDAGDGPEVRGARALYELLSYTSVLKGGSLPLELEGVLERWLGDRDEERTHRRRRDQLEVEVAELSRHRDELVTTNRRLRDQVDEIEGLVDKRTEERDRARTDAESWRRRHEELRQRRVVKAALKAAEVVGRVRGG